MKILHIISSIDLSGGGPSKSVSDLALHQSQQGQHVTIFTSRSDNPYLKKSPHPNLLLHFVKKKEFKKHLTRFKNANQFVILHGQRIYMEMGRDNNLRDFNLITKENPSRNRLWIYP